MILSFYDKDFRGLQDNASLVIDNKSYSLIRRGVELDELKCICEPFVESIQPTFLVVKNDIGNYVYGCLAGIPALTSENKTNITGTDLKSMLKSDILIDLNTSFANVNQLLISVFNAWNTQVIQEIFNCELVFNSNVGTIAFENLTPLGYEKIDVWEDVFKPYLKYYGLYMTAALDLVNGKVVFTIGRSMYRDLNVKLWEQGIYDYGKWVADVNETQGHVLLTNTNEYKHGIKWILRTDNTVTTNSADRDIYPIKRKLIVKEAKDGTEQTEKMNEANAEALRLLCDSMYKEDITLSNIDADFETKFNIWVRRGDIAAYKSLPCGELHYDASGLTKVQIGYRFTGLQFLL